VAVVLDFDGTIVDTASVGESRVSSTSTSASLSRARAEAAVAALTTTYKIAPGRLKGYGVGPLAPVASNAAEEGRGEEPPRRARPAVARYFSSSTSRGGSTGKGACGSAWYQ
jgi:beta-phosphoglucomutase-like phosphatase (HAD superfamily)